MVSVAVSIIVKLENGVCKWEIFLLFEMNTGKFNGRQ